MTEVAKLIQKKAKERVEEILEKYEKLQRARAFALEIATTEYSQSSSENYDQPGGGKTNEIHSSVEDYAVDHIDAKQDYLDAAAILSEIDTKINEELDQQHKIIIRNYVIRGFDAHEVNDRLNKLCDVVLHRSTISRKKNEAINKLIAKEIQKHYQTACRLVERYTNDLNAT